MSAIQCRLELIHKQTELAALTQYWIEADYYLKQSEHRCSALKPLPPKAKKREIENEKRYSGADFFFISIVAAPIFSDSALFSAENQFCMSKNSALNSEVSEPISSESVIIHRKSALKHMFLKPNSGDTEQR